MKFRNSAVIASIVVGIAACGGGGGGGDTSVQGVSQTNAAPISNAGPAQNTMTGTIVTLDGSASSDANGDALTYTWTLTSKPAGSVASLSSQSSAKPTFAADITGTYVASLVVNDGKVNSQTATVTITATAANAAPVANAGPAQNTVTGTIVTLDGSTSSDANGDTLTYAWTLTGKPAGSAASLSSPSSAKPTFAADVAGTYVASLIVNDGKINSQTASVTITATTANAAPVANAGPAQSAYMGDVIRLDGSSSTDANGDALTYAWSFQSYAGFFAPTLTGANTARASFSASDAGTYVLSLIVNDGRASSTASRVTITVADGVGPTPAGSGLVVQTGSNFWTFDEPTMTKKVDFSCGQSLLALDRRADGVVVGISSSQIFEVNPVSGVCSARGSTPEQLRALAVSAQGQLFGMSLSQFTPSTGGSPSHRLHKLTSSGASQSYVYMSGASNYVQAIDFGPDGQLYGVGIISGGGWALLRIDPNTGLNSVAFVMSTAPTLGDIDIDASGILRTMIDGHLYKFNVSTGALVSTTTVPGFPLGNSLAPIVYVP